MTPRTIVASIILAVLWAPAISQTGSMSIEGNGRIDRNVCKESDRSADGRCRTPATRTPKGEGGVTDVPASTSPSVSSNTSGSAGASISAPSGASVTGGTSINSGTSTGGM